MKLATNNPHEWELLKSFSSSQVEGQNHSEAKKCIIRPPTLDKALYFANVLFQIPDLQSPRLRSAPGPVKNVSEV